MTRKQSAKPVYKQILSSVLKMTITPEMIAQGKKDWAKFQKAGLRSRKPK